MSYARVLAKCGVAAGDERKNNTCMSCFPQAKLREEWRKCRANALKISFKQLKQIVFVPPSDLPSAFYAKLDTRSLLEELERYMSSTTVANWIVQSFPITTTALFASLFVDSQKEPWTDK